MDEAFTPWPEGTLVMAVTRSGLPLRRSCANHIFKLVSPPSPVEGYTECGFIQSARCLPCNYTTNAIDADFFWKKADAFDMAGMFGELQETIDWYQQVMDKVGKMMTGEPEMVMKDFG